MSNIENAQAGIQYLDMQAAVGITKHNGGFEATDELLALCHIDQARQVLNVGCGIGVGPAYIARKYACHVVGVDISEKMIEWSCLRAREEHVEAKVEFRTADVLDLPFEADRFDAVIVESVLAFVEDKPRALRECIRVTKPGGFVGLNETYWVREPSPEWAARVKLSDRYRHPDDRYLAGALGELRVTGQGRAAPQDRWAERDPGPDAVGGSALGLERLRAVVCLVCPAAGCQAIY